MTLKQRGFLQELLPPERALLLLPSPLLLLLPDLALEPALLAHLLDLRLEELPGTVHPDDVHVHLREGGQPSEARVRGQLAGPGLAVDEEELAEGEAPVAVLVHLGDHRLEGQVSLGRAQGFHHAFQLGQAEVVVLAGVEPGEGLGFSGGFETGVVENCACCFDKEVEKLCTLF